MEGVKVVDCGLGRCRDLPVDLPIQGRAEADWHVIVTFEKVNSPEGHAQLRLSHELVHGVWIFKRQFNDQKVFIRGQKRPRYLSRNIVPVIIVITIDIVTDKDHLE